MDRAESGMHWTLWGNGGFGPASSKERLLPVDRGSLVWWTAMYDMAEARCDEG